MFKTLLKKSVKATIEKACLENKLPRHAIDLLNDDALQIERPRPAHHGDYACGVALKLKRASGLAAMQIAEMLSDLTDPSFNNLAEIEISAPGFLNFRLLRPAFQNALREIHLQGANICELSAFESNPPAGLIEKLGSDAAKFYLLASKPGASMRINLETAKMATEENAPFCIQHTYDMCSSSINRAQKKILDFNSNSEFAPALETEEWIEWLARCKQSPEIFAFAFDEREEVFAEQRKLLLQLSQFTEVAEEAAIARRPDRLARYVHELCLSYKHNFSPCIFAGIDKRIISAQLGIIYATRQVLANALQIMGIELNETKK